MSTVTLDAPVRAGRSTRISGVDLARALAMLGMVIVHYVWPDETVGPIDTIAASLSGRAMPLFMLLGGVGVTLATTRSATPTGRLLTRAAILLVLGLVLHELTVWIAIVLQSYALLFAVAPLFRRLSDSAPLGSTVMVAVVGSWTYQVIGSPPQPTTVADLGDPVGALSSLLFDGYYPFFPVGSFFLLGLWIGRLDLRSDRVAAGLAGVGTAVAVGTIRVAERLVDIFAVDPSVFDETNGSFMWARLLDYEGHSQMLSWVLSAGGSSVAVLGLCLLVAPRLRMWLTPLIALGSLSLSFYVFQALLTQVVADPRTTSSGQELVTAVAIYVGFMVFAVLWKQRFRTGPLEALLRIGEGGRRSGS